MLTTANASPAQAPLPDANYRQPSGLLYPGQSLLLPLLNCKNTNSSHPLTSKPSPLIRFLPGSSRSIGDFAGPRPRRFSLGDAGPNFIALQPSPLSPTPMRHEMCVTSPRTTGRGPKVK